MLSFKVTDSHYNRGFMYLKCAAQLSSVNLYSDKQILKFIKRPPIQSITGQLANKIHGKSNFNHMVFFVFE